MHLGCIDERTGIAIVITGGAWHDAPLVETVCEQLPAAHELEHGVMAKGYESDKIRNKLRKEDIEPVIPPVAIARNHAHTTKQSISYGTKSNA
jgi:hypothetical protein